MANLVTNEWVDSDIDFGWSVGTGDVAAKCRTVIVMEFGPSSC